MREQAEGQHAADPAAETREQRQSAQQHRDDEAANPHHGQRLAAMVVALLRPVMGEQDPQYRRPGVSDRDLEIVDPDLPADRRHDRLQRSVAGRGDQHRRIEQQEMRAWSARSSRRRGCARSKPRSGLKECAAKRNLFVANGAIRSGMLRGRSVVRNLAKRRRICQRSASSAPLRSLHADFFRAHAERLSPTSAPPRPPQPKPAMAVPARIPRRIR